jgi:hypothetical protein
MRAQRARACDPLCLKMPLSFIEGVTFGGRWSLCWLVLRKTHKAGLA